MTTQRDTIDGILGASAKDMAKYQTDPKWAAQFDEGDSRVAERVEGRERSGEGTDVTPVDPPSGRPEPEASRVGAADAPTPPLGIGTASKRDGRHGRRDASIERLLVACRGLMVAGESRPTMPAICATARRSVRTGFQVFDTVEAMHAAALKDSFTREMVLERAVGPQLVFLTEETRDRILRAIYGGR